MEPLMAAEAAELALAVPAELSLEGLTEVSWGTKWRGFSFAEVIRTDPGFANHVHRFVHKTEAHLRFLYYARGRLTPLEYTAEGPCVSPPCPAHDVVTWGSKWHGCAFLEVLRVDPNYPVWLASKVACRTVAQNRFLAFANEQAADVPTVREVMEDTGVTLQLQLRLKDSERELARVGKVLIRWQRRLDLPYDRDARRDEALVDVLRHLEHRAQSAPAAPRFQHSDGETYCTVCGATFGLGIELARDHLALCSLDGPWSSDRAPPACSGKGPRSWLLSVDWSRRGGPPRPGRGLLYPTLRLPAWPF